MVFALVSSNNHDIDISKPMVILTSKYTLMYLLSGGLSWPQFLPTQLSVFLDMISPSGMFYEIIIQKEVV